MVLKKEKKKHLKKSQIENLNGNVDAEINELDNIFNMFGSDDSCIQISKQFISVAEMSKTYKCWLCKTSITGKDFIELRYRLWLHIMKFTHKEKLPNYLMLMKSEVKDVRRIISKELSEDLQKDFMHFITGSIHGFFKCSVCQCAVSWDGRHVSNHLKDDEHLKNKQLSSKLSNEEVQNRNEMLFNQFLSSVPNEFKDDLRYIRQGCIPGYVVCSLCCRTVIPSISYLQRHLGDVSHIENKRDLILFPTNLLTSEKYPKPCLLSKTGINVFLSLLKTNNPETRMNLKFLFKQHSKDIYFCQLCDMDFSGNNSRAIIKDIEYHFKGKHHKASDLNTASADMKNEDDSFPLFQYISEEDAKFLADSPAKTDLICKLCNTVVGQDVLLLIDHVQKKQHVKKRIQVLEKEKTDKLGAMKTVLDELCNKIESLQFSKEFFTVQEVNLQYKCELCNCVIGDSSDTFGDLEEEFETHVLRKLHGTRLLAHKQQRSMMKKKKKILLEDLFEQVPDLDKVDKMCVRLSKSEGQLKCRACKVRFTADLESLQYHIRINGHVEKKKCYH